MKGTGEVVSMKLKSLVGRSPYKDLGAKRI